MTTVLSRLKDMMNEADQYREDVLTIRTKLSKAQQVNPNISQVNVTSRDRYLWHYAGESKHKFIFGFFCMCGDQLHSHLQDEVKTAQELYDQARQNHLLQEKQLAGLEGHKRRAEQQVDDAFQQVRHCRALLGLQQSALGSITC